MKTSRSSKFYFVTFMTFGRFPLVLIFFIGAIIHAEMPAPWLFLLSLLALVSSAITDLFDGYFARKFGVVTKFGAHVDPLMDKFFYLISMPLLVFIAMKNDHQTHALFLLIMTAFFLMRDQWVTFLRSIGSIYNVSGNAHWSGKLRTCINFPLICCIYFLEEAPVTLFHPYVVYSFEVIALIVNLASLYTYTRNYWPYLRKSAELELD